MREPITFLRVEWSREDVMNESLYEQAVRDTAELDERLVVLTAEKGAGVRSLPPTLGARFVDLGMCEQSMIGVAAGLAMRGRRPFAHAQATFLTLRAYEAIRDDLGIPRLPTILVGSAPGFLSDGNGPTHQAIDDIGLMRSIPGMRVFCPCDDQELADAVPMLLEERAPVYVRHVPLSSALTRRKPFAFGESSVLSEGEDVGILTYGLCTRECITAARLIAERGRSVRLVHLPSLKPIDEAAVLATVRSCKATYTVEDHLLTGGLFSVVAELLVRRGLSGRVHPIALEDRWFRPAALADVLDNEGYSPRQLAARITRHFEM